MAYEGGNIHLTKRFKKKKKTSTTDEPSHNEAVSDPQCPDNDDTLCTSQQNQNP